MRQQYKTRFARMMQRWVDVELLSQRQAAERLGWSQASVKNWLKGVSDISVDLIEAFANETGRSPESVFAEMRGVTLGALPTEPTYSDILALVLALPLKDRAMLLNELSDSLVREAGQSNLVEKVTVKETTTA